LSTFSASEISAISPGTVGCALRGRATGQHPTGQRLLQDGHHNRGQHPANVAACGLARQTVTGASA
jgi:hypothetical protein